MGFHQFVGVCSFVEQALAVLAGWLLMRWVELPAQTWIRGDAWTWTHSVTCFPACCPFTLGCMPGKSFFHVLAFTF